MVYAQTDRRQRVRVDEHSGTATGAESSSLQQQQRRPAARDRETQRHRERERAAAGTLRFGWLNTLQSHPILTPSLPAHQPVRDVSQVGALLQPLFWQVSHPALHSVYLQLRDSSNGKRLCISPVLFTPKPRDPSAFPSYLSSPPSSSQLHTRHGSSRADGQRLHGRGAARPSELANWAGKTRCWLVCHALCSHPADLSFVAAAMHLACASTLMPSPFHTVPCS